MLDGSAEQPKRLRPGEADMEAETSSEELVSAEQFLVEYQGAFYLTNIIERYHSGHPEFEQVKEMFERAYPRTPLRAVPVKKNATLTMAAMSEGVITSDIDLSQS